MMKKSNDAQNTFKPTESTKSSSPSIDTDAPKRICFACGSAVGLKDVKCANCGTPLNEG